AYVLDPDIRRVAIAADGDVTVGEGETFERGPICAAHDVDAGPDLERKATLVDRFGAFEIGGNICRHSVLPSQRMVAELVAQRGAGTLVDAERGRAFRIELKRVLGEGIEDRARLGIGRHAGGRCRESATGKQR